MSVPSSHKEYTRKALLCFWEDLHPKGESTPLFEVEIDGKYFNKLTIFSMSNYVNELIATGTEYIEIEMPDADARIDWLKKFMTAPSVVV